MPCVSNIRECKYLIIKLRNRGALVSALTSETGSWGFESSVGLSKSHYSRWKLCIIYHLTSPLGTKLWIGKLSMKWNPLFNDCFERTNAGFHAPMVLNYSHCVVLGSEPAYDTSGAIELLVSVGIGDWHSFLARSPSWLSSRVCYKQTNKNLII